MLHMWEHHRFEVFPTSMRAAWDLSFGSVAQWWLQEAMRCEGEHQGILLSQFAQEYSTFESCPPLWVWSASALRSFASTVERLGAQPSAAMAKRAALAAGFVERFAPSLRQWPWAKALMSEPGVLAALAWAQRLELERDCAPAPQGASRCGL